MDGRVDGLEEIERARAAHQAALEESAGWSRSADETAESARERFYEAIDAAHGDPKQGKLTYEEIAQATGWSKGWVRLALKNYRDRKANTASA